MGGLLYELYSRFPVCMQNLAVSMYGYRECVVRHGKFFESARGQIAGRMYVSGRALQEYQSQALRNLVMRCNEKVPYYRKIFRKIGLEPRQIRGVEDLLRLPILEKSELRDNQSTLVADDIRKADLIVLGTSGTTGTPLRIWCNTRTRRLNYAYYDRFLRQAGIDYSAPRATFGGRLIVPSGQRKPPFWRYSVFQKNLLFSSYHLSDDNIGYYIDKLIRYRPSYIDAYPSSLHQIAAYASRHGLDLRGCTGGITTSAETLLDDQRRMIEDVFGVQVYDQYGSAEMCAFIGQCRMGNYHIHGDYGIVEILRSDGSPAKPGEEGELVCTGLINEVMPLLRYRIGDIGVLSDRTCCCGSQFPLLDRILGRMDDLITTPEGHRVGRLSPVAKGLPVREVQYVQSNVHGVVVLVVPDAGYCEAAEATLVAELQKRLGRSMKIDVQQVDVIPRSKSGKFRSTVSSVWNAGPEERRGQLSRPGGHICH
ncbi:MAG TPA: hypothetical protein VI078_00695 [bacterium]